MISRSLLISTALLLIAAFALGFYVLHLKRAAEQQRPPMAERLTAPVSATPEKVLLYVASDDDSGLLKREVSIPLPRDPQARGRDILRALVVQYAAKDAQHRLPEGADVNDVFLVNGALAVVDVNDQFASGHRSGVLVEQLTVASLAQTLAANLPPVKRVKVIVNGQERETLAGHADLRTLYDVERTRDLIKDIQ